MVILNIRSCQGERLFLTWCLKTDLKPFFWKRILTILWRSRDSQKEKGIASQPTAEERSTYYILLHIYQLEHCITKRKKMVNIKSVMHRVKIYFGSSLFSFYQGKVIRTIKTSFYQRKCTEISATLPTPQKASGSVLKTMWSFNSNKHILISTSYLLWIIRKNLKLSTDIVFLVQYP